MSKGFNIAEQAHVAVYRYPVDLDSSQQAAQTTDWLNFSDHSHVSIIVALGVTGAAAVIKLQSADDSSGTNATDMAFNVYKAETADSDVAGARTAIASTGLTCSGNNNIFYVIEVDAAELPQGQPFLGVHIADPAAATFGCVVAVFSGTRYGGPQSASIQS